MAKARSTRLSEIVRAASQVEASKTVSQPQPEPEEPQEAEVVDLVAALRASVEAAKKRREQAEAVREIQRRPVESHAGESITGDLMTKAW